MDKLLRRMQNASRARSLATLIAVALALAVTGAHAAHAAQAPQATQTEREREEVQGYRFQIITGDDSAVTHRIVDDLYKRLVPTFAAFRTELAQKRRML